MPPVPARSLPIKAAVQGRTPPLPLFQTHLIAILARLPAFGQTQRCTQKCCQRPL